MRIGIRREDKNQWERRAPLIPTDVKKLTGEGVEVMLQPSKIRIYSDDEYRKAGAVISEDLSSCPVIMAVKEIPSSFFKPGKTYVFFSHVIKGQAKNMPLLKRMMDLKCSLIDYELVADDKKRRLIFFGRHAGLAGMIDSLWALGRRLEWEGIPNPFSQVKMAHEYSSLDEAKSEIAAIGSAIEENGLPHVLASFICGFSGYGNASQGAQEIYDLLPVQEITPSQLLSPFPKSMRDNHRLFKVVFKEEDLVESRDTENHFELKDYYDNPQKYRSCFQEYLPHLDMLVNCVYWDLRYPRLVTKEYLRKAYSTPHLPSLRVIGDISIDIEGSIECSLKGADPGNPVYVYDPYEDRIIDGVEGVGPVIMAVDNLPCELSVEASAFFSKVLTSFIPDVMKANFSEPFEKLDLPGEIRRAVILHNGELTPEYKYLNRYL